MFDTITFQTAIAINQSPSIREKAILLMKLMQNVEKRFPDDQDLNAQYLDLVNYIYRSVLGIGRKVVRTGSRQLHIQVSAWYRP